MRNCLTTLLLLFCLSMALWLGWEPLEKYYDQFISWWQGRVSGIQQERPQQVPDTVQALPEPLLPPVFPPRTRSALKTVRVFTSIDVPVQSPIVGADFNTAVGQYLSDRYYDTDVILFQDTIPSRDAILVEVINLENSQQRRFSMWNTFDLTIDHDILPNSDLRVFVHLSGEYRERFDPEWSIQDSKRTELDMTNVLRSDANHLALALENQLRRGGDTFISW